MSFPLAFVEFPFLQPQISFLPENRGMSLWNMVEYSLTCGYGRHNVL